MWLDHLLLGRPKFKAKDNKAKSEKPKAEIKKYLTLELIPRSGKGNYVKLAFKLESGSGQGLLAQVVRAHP